MAGSPGANIAESEITTASQRSRSAWLSRNGTRLALPISSSPSARTIDVDRQLAPGREVRLQGLDVQEELALVVGRAAGVDAPVAHGGLEGRRGPEVERLGGLHVVVAVDQHGRRAGGRPAAIRRGRSGVRPWDGSPPRARPQRRDSGEPLRGALHVRAGARGGCSRSGCAGSRTARRGCGPRWNRRRRRDRWESCGHVSLHEMGSGSAGRRRARARPRSGRGRSAISSPTTQARPSAMTGLTKA